MLVLNRAVRSYPRNPAISPAFPLTGKARSAAPLPHDPPHHPTSTDCQRSSLRRTPAPQASTCARLAEETGPPNPFHTRPTTTERTTPDTEDHRRSLGTIVPTEKCAQRTFGVASKIRHSKLRK